MNEDQNSEIEETVMNFCETHSKEFLDAISILEKLNSEIKKISNGKASLYPDEENNIDNHASLIGMEYHFNECLRELGC